MLRIIRYEVYDMVNDMVNDNVHMTLTLLLVVGNTK